MTLPLPFVSRLAAHAWGMSAIAVLLGGAALEAQVPAALKVSPNSAETIQQPLRYRPDGTDFVIENGTEFFNRPLYGGNTAFRVDAGDRPEFSLYLPGRGGNLRIGIRTARGAKWLHTADFVSARYRPGEMIFSIRDDLLGAESSIVLEALALAATEGLVLRASLQGRADPVELFWAYGGVTGERGRRDGDIGTEAVPIRDYFQLRPEYCSHNTIELRGQQFALHSPAATIVGLSSAGAQFSMADARQWNAPVELLSSSTSAPNYPLAVGRAPLTSSEPRLILLQRVSDRPVITEELDTYRAVTKDRAGVNRAPVPVQLAPVYAMESLPQIFAEAEAHFAALRNRVSVETPDPFINAAAAALNVAADAVWDEPQQALMHGAIAWRSKLLGWRGAYALDALGWHDRARQHFTSWASRQNTDPIPATVAPPDEASNLARSEAALHTNGDLSNSHYDMNLVYIDALFRHLRWTGDLEFARQLWPVIDRHLAWERRLFRREFGPAKLPLYEGYAAIWASDDLEYHGGGTAHASAYNYFHYREAARLAQSLGLDATPYEREADLIARGMRELLWLPETGGFAEFKDLLGLQRVHASAGLWTFYHAMDAELLTPTEALQATRKVDREIPWLPVVGPGVPEDGLWQVPATTNWMPYSWSINNVVMGESIHTALGYWQAGRADDAFRLMKSALLASMFMGICPGNVGSLNYLDVYRRESQRDFADGGGVTARALVEGLFGLRPNLLQHELQFTPGFPASWAHAALNHPDVSVQFTRSERSEIYLLTPHFKAPVALKVSLPVRGDVASVVVNGNPVPWVITPGVEGYRRVSFDAVTADHHEIAITWRGTAQPPTVSTLQRPAAARSEVLVHPSGPFDEVDLAGKFNDRVTRIFQQEYRSPRSPHVSLAIPKQGIGAWAGGVNTRPEIDDTGLRAAAASAGGRIVLPDGLSFITPTTHDAPNILFTSQWDNYPREATVSLNGRARVVWLLMAGTTNWMQSRIDNGEVVVTYTDGSRARLELENPTTWWPIEQDYLTDAFAFRRSGPVPWRVKLKTGEVYLPSPAGGAVPGGTATVLRLALDPSKDLRSITVHTLSNEVVIGLMAATLERP
ncbi:MAG: DUF4450 domain-containing protein [Opitutus sp.]